MKRIVICADGTWNQRDQIDEKTKKRRPTNVTKVARAIRARDAHGIDQVVIYHDGVGTSGGLDKFTGGGFGHGIEDNIRNLYRSILYNFEAGDELFFFGFSRGAFTVRSLAGFMFRTGLLQKDDDYYLPEIYACYERGQGPGSKGWERAFRNVKDTRPCPKIKFIGVWDTVGALGAPGLLGHIFNGRKYQYHDVSLNPCIANAYQALAIDERRKPFKPNLWRALPGWGGRLEQAWFPGVHSNIGGGYTPDGLANEALHWMVENAEAQGLEFDDAFLAHYTPCFDAVLHDSMTLMYRAFGKYTRPIGEHLGAGEGVHQAAIDRRGLPKCEYDPPSLEGAPGSAAMKRVYDTSRIERGAPCEAL